MSKFELQIPVEHAVLFLSDPTVDEAMPSDTGAAVVTATDDCICFWVQPYDEGGAQLTISDQPCKDGEGYFSGTINTPSKILTVSDSRRFPYLNVPVEDVKTPIEMWAFDAENPRWTWIRLPIASF